MTLAIVGAGIGGLTAALSLHAAGRRDVVVLEAAREIRDVGVGINLPPHAVRELTELGLGDQLAKTGVLTKELAYYDPNGQLIWAEPRGLAQGYKWPQYSIHRGALQRLLLDAVRQRLGPSAVRIGTRATAIDTHRTDRAVIEAADQSSERPFQIEAEVAVIADGIRSVLRDSLYGAAIPIATNGWVMYRGTTKAPPFLSGGSMVILGDETQRVVVYPIGDGVINWLLVRPKEATASVELGNWNLRVASGDVAKFAEAYRFDWLDIHALISASSEAYEYPMADIDPLPRWVFGRAALLGDAAHAMYPFGSNGASQAIIDARVFAYEIATAASVDEALGRYEQQRRPVTGEVQLANRRQASDVMARVSAMARRGAHGDAKAELEQVEQRYKQLAGFDIEALNSRKSWSVHAAV